MAMLSNEISVKWSYFLPDLSNRNLFHGLVEFLLHPCGHPSLHNEEQIDFSV